MPARKVEELVRSGARNEPAGGLAGWLAGLAGSLLDEPGGHGGLPSHNAILAKPQGCRRRVGEASRGAGRLSSCGEPVSAACRQWALRAEQQSSSGQQRTCLALSVLHRVAAVHHVAAHLHNRGKAGQVAADSRHQQPHCASQPEPLNANSSGTSPASAHVYGLQLCPALHCQMLPRRNSTPHLHRKVAADGAGLRLQRVGGANQLARRLDHARALPHLQKESSQPSSRVRQACGHAGRQAGRQAGEAAQCALPSTASSPLRKQTHSRQQPALCRTHTPAHHADHGARQDVLDECGEEGLAAQVLVVLLGNLPAKHGGTAGTAGRAGRQRADE